MVFWSWIWDYGLKWFNLSSTFVYNFLSLFSSMFFSAFFFSVLSPMFSSNVIFPCKIELIQAFNEGIGCIWIEQACSDKHGFISSLIQPYSCLYAIYLLFIICIWSCDLFQYAKGAELDPPSLFYFYLFFMDTFF